MQSNVTESVSPISVLESITALLNPSLTFYLAMEMRNGRRSFSYSSNSTLSTEIIYVIFLIESPDVPKAQLSHNTTILCSDGFN